MSPSWHNCGRQPPPTALQHGRTNKAEGIRQDKFKRLARKVAVGRNRLTLEQVLGFKP